MTKAKTILRFTILDNAVLDNGTLDTIAHMEVKLQPQLIGSRVADLGEGIECDSRTDRHAVANRRFLVVPWHIAHLPSLVCLGVSSGFVLFFKLVEVQIHPSEIEAKEGNRANRHAVEIKCASPLQAQTEFGLILMVKRALFRWELVGRHLVAQVVRQVEKACKYWSLQMGCTTAMVDDQINAVKGHKCDAVFVESDNIAMIQLLENNGYYRNDFAEAGLGAKDWKRFLMYSSKPLKPMASRYPSPMEVLTKRNVVLDGKK